MSKLRTSAMTAAAILVVVHVSVLVARYGTETASFWGDAIGAAAAPFVFVRVPAIADGLRRLDHASGLRHRPATALVDALAVTPSDSYSLALWNAHVERARAAA